jgi:hypothetical protein
VIPEWKPIEEPPLIPKAVWYIAPVVLLGLAAGGWFYYNRDEAKPPPPAAKVAPPPVAAPVEPVIKNPLPPTADSSEAALPPLDESDAALRGTLAPLADAKAIDQFLAPKNLVRNIVVTVDNLPRGKTAVDRRPVKPIPGTTVVITEGETLTLSERNFERYAPFVALVQSMDSRQLGGIYLHYYPLFQEAYEGLGYPDKYFNDRLVEVIDHLLETPEPKGPIKLVQPRVYYEYADPRLEELSAGQKALIRMGNANAAEIKKKLKELRDIVARQPR